VNQLEDKNVPEDGNGEDSADFESHLTQALRRVDAPEGFADRVIARAKLDPAPRVLMMKPSQQAWLGGAIAAALFLGVFGAEQIHQRQQQRAALVQQQFEAGIRITDDALNHAREQLEQDGVGAGR
jgi:uncharacterized protein CbrC (UPF0167 family)